MRERLGLAVALALRQADVQAEGDTDAAGLAVDDTEDDTVRVTHALAVEQVLTLALPVTH